MWGDMQGNERQRPRPFAGLSPCAYSNALQKRDLPGGKLRIRLADAGALYLEVVQSGSKRWFWKYYFSRALMARLPTQRRTGEAVQRSRLAQARAQASTTHELTA